MIKWRRKRTRLQFYGRFPELCWGDLCPAGCGARERSRAGNSKAPGAGGLRGDGGSQGSDTRGGWPRAHRADLMVKEATSPWGPVSLLANPCPCVGYPWGRLRFLLLFPISPPSPCTDPALCLIQQGCCHPQTAPRAPQFPSPCALLQPSCRAPSLHRRHRAASSPQNTQHKAGQPQLHAMAPQTALWVHPKLTEVGLSPSSLPLPR